MPVIPVRDTLHIYQGATFQHRWAYIDSDGKIINLTSYTARLQIRDNPNSTIKLVDATDGNGKLVIIAADGTIDLLLTAAETTLLDFDAGVFDLELIHPDTATVDKLSFGTVKLVREITK